MVIAGRLDVEGGASVALLWHQLRSAPCQRLPVQATEYTLVGSHHDRTTIAGCAYVPIHTIALALTRVRPEGQHRQGDVLFLGQGACTLNTVLKASGAR